MIFEGKVDESEVGRSGRVATGNYVGAYDNRKFNAILDYIAPKGVAENGAIQFAIKGTLEASENNLLELG
jgi:HlyD family secretion protein